MRRTITAAVVGLAATGSVIAIASSAHASTDLGGGYRSYVLSTVIGPISGQGDLLDEEARVIFCNSPSDSILAMSTTTSLKTSHGTARAPVLTVTPVGVFWNPENDHLDYGAFVARNGKPGWETVTLSITCRTNSAKPGAAPTTTASPSATITPTPAAGPTQSPTPKPTKPATSASSAAGN